MPLRIVQTTRTPEYDLHGIVIDRARKTGVLIRQSKKGADLDSRESRLRQESLVPVAIALRGDDDDSSIILYDEGSGVSGTKGYDQRPQLSRLYLDLANGVIGSIIVARADRLFRDKHFRNVSMFTELAERQRIMLIVPGRATYDFTRTKDLQAFQREMQEAYSYIATQVAYMHDTRRQKIQRGMYGGGNLPAPYAIERAAEKDQQIPVIYRPWQPIAIQLFERFRDYDFMQSRIARYIEQQPCIFPYPSAEDLQRYMIKTLMRKTIGGYTFSSADSIRKYFSNLTLAGYAKVGCDEAGNTVFLANAFEEAVPYELVAESYAALTGSYPDGSPFQGRRFAIRTHAKKAPMAESAAILHGLLQSSDGMVYYWGPTRTTKPGYACNRDTKVDGRTLKGRSGIVQSEQIWSVPCQELDTIVIERLCELARGDGDISERIKSYWAQRQSNTINEAQILKTQVEHAEAQIRRLDKLLTDPATPLSEAAERRYIEALHDAEDELKRLLAKQSKQQIGSEDPERAIASFYHVLSHLPTEFPKLPLESQKRIARQVIRNIHLERISAHLLLLHVEWHNGIAVCPDVALIWRGKGARIGREWTVEEETLLREFYPSASQHRMMEALPRRAWQSVRERARTMNIHRSATTTKAQGGQIYHETMTFADLQAATALVGDAIQQERIREVTNELARNTGRGRLSAHWWLPLSAIGYASATADGRQTNGSHHRPARTGGNLLTPSPRTTAAWAPFMNSLEPGARR
jgi:hypothetical protein